MRNVVPSTQSVVSRKSLKCGPAAHCLLPSQRYFRGYTLIEMIVSVGIFSLVMLVVSGAYVSLIGLDRQSRATNELVTNLSFALESMSRSIRTGSNYVCSPGDSNGNSTDGSCHQITFTDNNLGQQVTYRRNSTGTIGECIGVAAASCTDANAIVLTNSRVQIGGNGLTFYVRGVGASDQIQPQVTFTITGTMPNGNSGGTAQFSIQSSATQRRTE